MTTTPDPTATAAAPAPATPAPPVGIDVRIQQYIKLRDKIKSEDDAHKKKMEPYRELLETLNGVMLNHLTAIGGDSVRTENGTVYKTVKKSASLEDADSFKRHVIGTEAWELLDWKANAKAAEDFALENGVLPPGVKYTTTTVVGVRRT